MADLIPTDDVPDDEEALFAYVAGLVERGRQVASARANETLTMTYWLIGRAISVNLLRQQRADYGKQIVATLSRQLTTRFGRGFELASLRRMIQFAEEFPDFDTVATLSRQLSWSHLKELLPLRSDEARRFYIEQTARKRLGVRELRRAIARKAWERREIANSQIPEGSAVPRDTFTDPLFLDMLGLHDSYLERDLEAAILNDMRAFLMEVGPGFTFVASQKRMTVGAKEYRLDLLFFSRPLRRLVAVELKLGAFQPAHVGQMEAYLKWLDVYEREPGEEAPVGLILCSEADREEVEFLELHKDGIAVVEYWTTLPPKAALESKLRQIVRDAQERLTRRGIPEELGSGNTDD